MKWSRIAAVLCVFAVFAAFASSAWATKYVALGDSYSSGTGTRIAIASILSPRPPAVDGWDS